MNYKQDENILELLHDGSMTTEVSVEGGDVVFFSIIDSYDYSFISLSIEEWEKVKEWVDKKIGENGNVQNRYSKRLQCATIRKVP